MMRTPNETDDLDAIVRYHGAMDVLDALVRVATEAFGEERALENVQTLLTESAARVAAS